MNDKIKKLEYLLGTGFIAKTIGRSRGTVYNLFVGFKNSWKAGKRIARDKKILILGCVDVKIKDLEEFRKEIDKNF